MRVSGGYNNSCDADCDREVLRRPLAAQDDTQANLLG